MRPRWQMAAVLMAAAALTATASGCKSAAGLVPETSQLADGKLAAKTDDGWLLNIRHYKPGRPDREKRPVVLMHGFGVNGTFWTLDEQLDLAHFLSKRHNYDVYVPDLRGMGESRRENPFGDFAGADMGEGRDPYKWVLDDYALKDIPAIIAEVKRRSGASTVNWVGHSMGGMIMYAYLTRSDRPQDVQTFVACGSPVFMFQPADAMLVKMGKDLWLLEYVSVANVSKILSIIAGGKLTPFDTLYYNRDNVTQLTIKRMYAYVMEDLPVGVARQLDQMVHTGRFLGADGKFDYSDRLDRIRAPMLFIAAKKDNMSPPGVVAEAMQRVASKDKTWIHLAAANDFDADYGHCDIIWGKNAPQRVFPLIAKWLDARQKPRAATTAPAAK